MCDHHKKSLNRKRTTQSYLKRKEKVSCSGSEVGSVQCGSLQATVISV